MSSFANLVTSAPAVPRAHLAALRAWLQGLSIDAIAARYLEDEDGEIPDARIAHRMILAVRDAMMQRAEQHGRPDIAELLARPPRHSDIGMSRAGAALGEIEALGAPAPAPGHGVQLWFAPVLARRLRAAGVLTIGDLQARIRERGTGWWRQLPKIGAVAARTLEAWLAALPAPVDRTTLPAPCPLERQHYPADLDGRGGLNRGPDNGLTAQNDLQAIQTWLSLWASPETVRAYRREAERFLAWCVVERGKPLSSAAVEDVLAYREFLADPQPAERWIGPGLQRDREGWKPFVKKLTPRSVAYAESVLKAMFSWLCDPNQGYLKRNPWRALPRLVKQRRNLQIQKALPIDQWSSFAAWLAERAIDDAHARTARATILLLRDSGLRCAEAAGAGRSQLHPVADRDAPGLWGELEVIGKGALERVVPISVAAYEALQAHWRDRGEPENEGPLIAPLKRPATPRSAKKTGAEGYSSRGLRQLVTKTYAAYRESLPAEVAELTRLRLAPHALRHTFGTHSIESGVELDVAQAWMGHADPATTAIYARPGEKRRRQQIGRLYVERPQED